MKYPMIEKWIDRGYMEVNLGRGFKAKVSIEDFEKVNEYKWTCNKNYKHKYAITVIPLDSKKETSISMHRLIAGLERGDNKQVDHINGDGLDNRRENIRICSHTENMWNRRVQNLERTRSNYIGVYQLKSGNYNVKFKKTENGKRKDIYLGTYKTQVEAALAYDMAVLKERGEFAQTNFSKDELLRLFSAKIEAEGIIE